jgi:hypothetical protein
MVEDTMATRLGRTRYQMTKYAANPSLRREHDPPAVLARDDPSENYCPLPSVNAMSSKSLSESTSSIMS